MLHAPICLGIDIGLSQARILGGRRSGRQFHLERYTSLSYPPGSLIGRYLEPIVDEWRLRKQAVALSLHGPNLYVQGITLPGLLNRRQQISALQFQIARLLNVPAEQSVYDYFPVDAEEPELCRWIVVAARRSQTESLAGMVRAAGLKPKTLEPEVSAIMRCIMPLPEDTALVYVQADYALVAFFIQGKWIEQHFIPSPQEDTAKLERRITAVVQDYARRHHPIRGIAWAGEPLDLSGALAWPVYPVRLKPDIILPPGGLTEAGSCHVALGLAMRGHHG
jgi:hypothetical protein